ncbi:helix-turn-helix domain-containing protein (plasmid) [Limosilactobacillus reuteri]|jgi:transcriptional regulator with XRE-family HTH domain
MSESLGQYLRSLRNSKHMSMAEVRKQTGITNSRLSKLENDQVADPSISVICKLSNCYEVDVVDILNEAGMNIEKSTPFNHTSFLNEDEVDSLQKIIDLLTKERWNQ